MIPAVLSCIYVVFLYRTLNSVGKQTTCSSTAFNAGTDQLTALSHRLGELQQRLATLLADMEKDGGK
jgi:uncharacterized protein YoxC